LMSVEQASQWMPGMETIVVCIGLGGKELTLRQADHFEDVSNKFLLCLL